MPTNLRLPFEDHPLTRDPLQVRDEAARAFAVDPARNVVLEASAGTGKTRVLVTRYLNLLRAGVDPANILAITFTRKAAAEMRERIVRELRAMAAQSPADAARWRELRDRLGEIGISTIDAFCLSLLREFPLEADLDPGFQVADETEVPRFVDEALDAALRAGRRLARSDEDVALVLAGLGERRLRSGLTALLGRRMVVRHALRRFLHAHPAPAPSAALEQARARLASVLESAEGGLRGFLADGPVLNAAYALVDADLRATLGENGLASRSALERLSGYFLTKTGDPRKRPAPAFRKDECASAEAWKRHSNVLARIAPDVADILATLDRNLNLAMARGVERLFHLARWRYRRALEAHASLDFSEALARTLALLRKMDEFAQSRYRLEARYHHVLVDEFQDTSRAQWKLVSRLIESWGEGMGLAHDAPLQPSIFIVGDRKQSIYAFRDADVRTLRRARLYIDGLRPGGDVRRSIARSFRSAPALLAFTNDLFGAIDKVAGRADGFRYAPADRFPVHLAASPAAPANPLGLVMGASARQVARGVAAEIQRLLQHEQVRDRQTGLPRLARPGDVAILFRSRESHREFELALEARAIPTYVYKGLGFFDADEVKDLVALLRFLAEPWSDLRAAAFLRSRFVRLSDVAMRRLAPGFASALRERAGSIDARGALPEEDGRVLSSLRAALPGWLSIVDRLPPAEVFDRVLDESAYAFELRGARETQARENVKKVRALLRRIQNRGYATLPRIADHLDRLSAGDESNAIIDAADAVNLMTVHAAKGLEFPIVFLVNLGRGTGTHVEPVLVVADPRRQLPLVSVGGGLPEAEEATRQRDIEETKRLLYVAVTRARERLYLSAVLKDGRFKPTRGSLGEVLPASLRETFEKAAVQPWPTGVDWVGPDGSAHRFLVCSDAEEETAGSEVANLPEGERGGATNGSLGGDTRPDEVSSDFERWEDRQGVRHVPVTVLAPGQPGAAVEGGRRPSGEGVERRLAGTLVHRLFQAFHDLPDLDVAAVADRARALASPDDLAGVEDADAVVAEAAATYLGVRGRADVKALLDPASCEYEVPFSLLVPAGEWQSAQPGSDDAPAEPRAPHAASDQPLVVRGTIDCLARLPDGRLVVVEIKTGRPHEWHEAQLGWYVRAVRELFPGQPVEGRIIYA